MCSMPAIETMETRTLLLILLELTQELRDRVVPGGMSIHSSTEAQQALASVLQMGGLPTDMAGLSDNDQAVMIGRSTLKLLASDSVLRSQVEDLVANPPEDSQMGGADLTNSTAVVLGALITWLQTKLRFKVHDETAARQVEVAEIVAPHTDSKLLAAALAKVLRGEG